jgi:hypothetical protein
MNEPAPSSLPRRRVLLFGPHFEPALVHELTATAIDVVVTVQGSVDGVPFVSLRDLLDVSSALDPRWSSNCNLEPTATELLSYARGASRIGREPFTHEANFEFGGGIALDELVASARLHVGRSLELLRRHRVDEVWFIIAPHLGLDHALAIAARLLRIPVLIIRQLPFPAKFAWEWRLDGRVLENTAPLDFEPWTQGAIPLNLFYMAPRQWDPPLKALKRRVRSLLRELVRLRWRTIGARAWRGAVDRRWWRLAIWIEGMDPATRPQAARHLAALAAAGRARSRRRFIDLQQVKAPFVYFPLHYEPEANADVYGGDYAFQPDALAALSAAVPEGWCIFVKENPAQGFVRRGEAFYRLIAALPNVFWVPDETSSAMLVERAALVASLCGTVGYESLLVGKPCLYFGDPWYAGLPGAVRFRAGIDLAALAKTRVDKSELDAAVNALVSAAADGIAMRRFTALVPDAGESEAMTRLTARSLARISRAARAAFG